MFNKLKSISDLIISIVFSIVIWLVLGHYDAFEKLMYFLRTHEEYELDEFLLLLMVFGIISIFYIYRRVVEQRVINSQLKKLNETLEQKVKNEIDKRRKQEQMLIQQSKLAAMGEMIGNIAHQWRQPLNALGLVIQNIQFSYSRGELNEENLSRSINKANMLTTNMSNTIDDFRNFFKPDKQKEIFKVYEPIKKAIYLIEATLEKNKIKIETSFENDLEIYGFENEFSQSILNIISNAKDAIIENNISLGEIKIKTFKIEDNIIIEIKDNAGGVKAEIKDKIFEPYFTTKEEGKGMGIGLYMAKTIIENNMDGQINIKDIPNGSCFVIKLSIPNIKNDI
ncbi:hypothetical protein CRV00_12745 [Malaciobacter molluscorum]|uniref:sensor histidine kinase n=1 Tax=Malaciobacter molluscorum TaxID=1032072 RepID=UPI00100C3427|nr:HAMP domain-containing sensor histidine kinase [Malaciobacter molluscorum]RXJ92783.1 hypothetical protein CRV00_12745 [Malaciobacter molluscorum]